MTNPNLPERNSDTLSYLLPLASTVDGHGSETLRGDGSVTG